MSADTSKDFNLIQDEDVLKKMWQETEDFGRKKEIRSHMYKLREQRLKEFYNSNESTEIHRTSGKTCDSRTHADSLTDQSFLSLKSKEIRDSESPTRDSGYRIAERHNDHGWDVLSANEISMDGKTHTTIRQATTAGTQKIDGGKLDFAAKNEQVATVFQDGDDKNFTKSVGAKSNTMITQEAVGGDENSSFKASSTKVSSSSKVVTEHRSTLGETIPLTTSDSVVRKVYTKDIPSDLKNHPSYMEGKTKVTQETRTLPDGTTVTTTRYETKGGTTSQSQTTSKYSTTSKSSSEHSSSIKSSQMMQGGSTVVKQLQGTDEVDFICEPRQSVQVIRSSDQNVHQAKDRSQKVHQEHHETMEEHRSSSHARSELHERRLAEQQLLDKQTEVQKAKTERVHHSKETVQKSHSDVSQKSVNEKLQGTHTQQVIVDMVPVDNIEVTRVIRPSEHVTHIITATHDTKGTDIAATTTKSTTYHHDTTRDNKKLTNEQFITTERQHEVDTRKEPIQARPEPQKGKQPSTEKPQYEQPEKRQPIQPPKSEWEQPTKTEGQYDTTYRTDYTNRKISVEVSPTHDAFARSLRAVSPERLPPHLVSPTHTTKTTSSTSLRSSTSPDKCRYPSRGSPERKSRSGSPRKSTDRFSSTETITYSSRASPEKKTPTKYVNGIDIIRRRDDDSTTHRSTYESDTITKKKKTSTDTITRKPKPRSRSPSPISTVASEIEYFKNVNELVTDLDEVTDETVTRRTDKTISTTERPSSLEITTRKTKKVTERSPTSPLKDVSPTKASPPRAASPQKARTLPEDRQMKRTDTYEERCRQILGITETNERRRSSLEKSSIKRSSFSKDSTMSPTEPPRKKSVESPRRTSFERRSPEKSPTKEKPFRPTEFVTQSRKSPEKKSPSPTKELPSQARRSPEKKRPCAESPTKLQEFPSQIRRSPEKQPVESYPGKRSPSKDSPSKINEFPSQIRKSPERQPLEPYPQKKRPCEKAPSNLNEFPSQIRRSPERQPLEPYPERKSPTKDVPSKLSEFPSQIRKSPVREPLEPYPQKKKPCRDTPSKLEEFPSQARRSPDKEPLGPYPEKKKPCEDSPSKLKEFPSQIRRSPERQPLEQYPEKKKPCEDSPSKLKEFPSQIRKSPERQPLEQYPEKKKPCEDSPSKLGEFPSQIRRSPERRSPSDLTEFPSQSRHSPERYSPTRKVPCSLASIPAPTKKSPETSKPVKKSKKPKSKRPSGTSISSSSSEDEEEITEEVTRVTTTTYENSIPVKEPEVTKKFMSQLCREDEVKHTDITKKTTEELLEQEIIQNGLEAHPHKTVKKDLSRTPVKPTIKKFIDNERHITTVQDTQRSTVKKTIDKDTKKDSITRTTKAPLKKQPEVHRTEKTKFIGETEYTEEYCKTKPKLQKTTEKITLIDLERSNKNQVDNKVHTRTHRIDDNVNKKTTSAVVTNGDVCRKMKPKDTPKAPTVTKTVTTLQVTNKRAPSPKVEDVKQKVTSQSRYTTTVKKTINVQDQISKPKPAEPKKLTPIKKVVDITKLSPSKPEQTTTVKKQAVSSISITTTRPKTTKPTKTTPKGKASKPTKLQNGHISSDTDEDIDSMEGSTVSLTAKSFTTKEHVSRVTKTKDDQDIGIRTSRKPDKCITTKTLIINNKDDKREVIVDLQRSKSSREPTPDRLCPVPLSSDDESGVPRYPDEVEEPDDGSLRRKPKPTRLSDVPIIESEDIAEFSRFTEVKDTKKITEVDRVDQTDESLLSVNKKIHKFLDTAEKLTKEPLKVSGPAPKVERPKMEVVEDLKSDDCLLSVSDKVSKFISTAEQLITPNSIPDRPKSPRCQNYPYEPIAKPKHSSDTTIDIEETIKDDDCLLSVSEKVSKFISTADKLATSDAKKQTVSLAKIDIKSRQEPSRKSPERKVPDRKSPERKSPVRFVDTECVQIETEEDIYTRRTSPTRSTPSPDEKTPPRRPSNQYKEILKTGMSSTRRSSSPKLPDSTPKSAKEEPKPVLSPTGRLRSTESIKRAKALFENISKEKDSAWTKDILSRPSVFEGRKSKVEERRSSLKKKLSYSEEDKDSVTREQTCSRFERRSKSPEKDRPRSTSPQKEQPELRQSPDQEDVPHYMLPLDRSLRPNSPHRESLGQSHPEKPIEEPEPHTTKFNVTLKRTDSGKAAKSITSERRKSSITLEKRITEEEIEEIFELEVLEELLEKVIGYDLRRKIRTQIRLVKKLISENTLESYIAKLKNSRRDSISKTSRSEHVRKSSPERRTVDYTKTYQHTSLTDEKDQKSQSEYHSSYSYHTERRTSSEFTRKTTSRSQSPEVKPVRATSPQKQTPSRRSPDKEPKSRVSPVRRTKMETKTFTQLKKSAPTSKPVEDDKPEWVKSRNLRKTSETAAPVVKKTTTTTTTKTTKKETVRSSSPAKEVKTTDLITSSYGVGPTDENGTPLFGLRALRAQNKNDVTKVQGTVVTSEYYSENGEEPVGQISVTKYSTDPKDLGTGDQLSSTNKGLTSVTTTQKFGYKDTPSLKSLTSKKKEIKSTEESKTSTKSNKITRRNSVKEISQKFIDNAVDILKSERQTSYPKAGLILRTSSFKDSRTGDSGQARRASSDKEDFESSVTVKTTKSRTEGGETTFLTNKSRVTGVQDVIDRMKTEEYREGDSAEDAEARSLLNKFIGSQVRLSGMESRAMSSSTSTKKAVTSDSGGGVKRTSKITITVTEGGKPVTKTRVFQHPITEEDLEHIWDEQTLRLLVSKKLLDLKTFCWIYI
nr:unnamed protein product [Callosobruchus chinensis]